eukprot:TRINITY_DN16530_c0_g1_i1.p1 TRINITY_DN16530_c0_g1~~TRINITY_DN16530_c0_g1_i1.p1  ORF type:complete len:117 (-),score=14.85 TRINITY_DN16530_c0_g1_i1:131-481(-)
MTEWETTLFDCFTDPKVLLVSWCCAPCQVSFQSATIEGRDCSILDLIIALFCGPCCAVSARGKIREKYGFEGSMMSDILAVWCCPLCAISQQTRQMEMRGDRPSGLFMDQGQPLLG